MASDLRELGMKAAHFHQSLHQRMRGGEGVITVIPVATTLR